MTNSTVILDWSNFIEGIEQIPDIESRETILTDRGIALFSSMMGYEELDANMLLETTDEDFRRATIIANAQTPREAQEPISATMEYAQMEVNSDHWPNLVQSMRDLQPLRDASLKGEFL